MLDGSPIFQINRKMGTNPRLRRKYASLQLPDITNIKFTNNGPDAAPIAQTISLRLNIHPRLLLYIWLRIGGPNAVVNPPEIPETAKKAHK